MAGTNSAGRGDGVTGGRGDGVTSGRGVTSGTGGVTNVTGLDAVTWEATDAALAVTAFGAAFSGAFTGKGLGEAGAGGVSAAMLSVEGENGGSDALEVVAATLDALEAAGTSPGSLGLTFTFESVLGWQRRAMFHAVRASHPAAPWQLRWQQQSRVLC